MGGVIQVLNNNKTLSDRNIPQGLKLVSIQPSTKGHYSPGSGGSGSTLDGVVALCYKLHSFPSNVIDYSRRVSIEVQWEHFIGLICVCATFMHKKTVTTGETCF